MEAKILMFCDDFMINIQKQCFWEAYKDLVQNIFILIRMSIEGYMVMFVEIHN